MEAVNGGCGQVWLGKWKRSMVGVVKCGWGVVNGDRGRGQWWVWSSVAGEWSMVGVVKCGWGVVNGDRGSGQLQVGNVNGVSG